MNLTITDDMIIKFITGGNEYTIDKMILNENGTDYEVYNNEPTPSHDYSQDYFTIESLEDGNTLTLTKESSAPSAMISCSDDNGTSWGTVMSTSSWNFNKGDKLMFNSQSATWASGTSVSKAWHLSCSKTYKVYGNIMTLIWGPISNAASKTELRADYSFFGLFYGSTTLVDASNLVMPANTLTSSCYRSIFYGCTALTTAPSTLPATTLISNCYRAMFSGCSSLTTVPELAATTLANYCYAFMFYGCTSLTTAPELPATTVADYCYNYMFNGCTSLTTAPELPATTLANSCYRNMFVSCTSLTTVPELPATTLVSGCYAFMFYSCSSLNYIKCVATSISASNCLDQWVNGVAASGTFVKNASMTGWSTGIDGIPSGWTVQDAA